jgi:hypothetical protein
MPLSAERSEHPEQDAAKPALPLPEGEDVGPARPAAGAPPSPNGSGRAGHDDEGDDDEDDVPPPTTVAGGRAAAHGERAGEEDDRHDEDEDDLWVDGDEGEGVRVLGRRPQRRRSGDEPPVEPLPGTAAIGARHIVPGDIGRAGFGPLLARLTAVLALAFVVAAVLLVVWGLR